MTSPHGYNETVAQNFFPLSKEKAIHYGYGWRDAEKKEYSSTKKAADLPHHSEVIECANCKRGFRIIPMELKFLKSMNLPLPRNCLFCRIDVKFQRWIRNLKIVARRCNTCSSEFETSYTKDEVPSMLCKKCYLTEVA